ncbi:response regulator [Microvirga calopogonii]|uniref:response regulator n=1 Tax=Microvirga calopogonii TaxID=2078013 RepID=UPI000E0D87E3|nr:response regulator [Microvirga calopogonii]
MDSTFPELSGPSVLVVEDDAKVGALIARALRQAGYEAVLASSGEDALDLIAAADFDGLYCTIELPGQVDGWEVGTTFSFIWPDKPAVYASAVQTTLPGRLRHGIFLRKPFAMDRLVRVFETGVIAARAKRHLT